MRSRLAAALLAAVAAPGYLFAQTNAQPSDWIQLFNGKNLDGWVVKIRGHETGTNFGNTFRVENGAIRVSYDQYDKFNERFGHMFYNKNFSYYRIAVEYRFVGEQAPGGPSWAYKNSGIMVHGQSPESMLKDQDFPISIEVQLLGGRETGERPTANLCTREPTWFIRASCSPRIARIRPHPRSAAMSGCVWKSKCLVTSR